MKISFLGAGQVGGQAAFLSAAAGLGDIALFDSKPGLARGKAMDIGQSLAILPGKVSVVGSDAWEVTGQSDVLVVTAGLARKQGMSREDLLGVNAAIVLDVVGNALRWSPDAIVIIVTNPINTIAYLTYRMIGLDPGRVIGLAGVLDNARFAYFIAQELSADLAQVESWVIGDHGDHMVPVVSQTRVSGISLSELAQASRIEMMCKKARNAGTEIVSHLREGSAYFAPGAAICRMLKAIAGDLSGSAMPCSTLLDGEYGVRGLIAGVPVILGRGGVERIVEFDLDANERAQFGVAAASIRDRNRMAEQMMSSVTA